jgi:hypothetical protein
MKILSLHYLPCVLWMRHFLEGDCVLDVHEHFVKQTYRNRAVILSANGPLPITIPVKKVSNKMMMKDIIADPEVHWQKQHWESIKAAYGSSPFFVHYADGFEALYESEITSIMQFELDLLKLLLRYMKTGADITLSNAYIDAASGNDLRGYISPKNTVADTFKSYLQVFAGKFPFQPNLSVIDVLFNLGPRGWEDVVMR